MNLPTYSSAAIANRFLRVARESGDTTITPMKVQKLVYIAHGWHLAYTDGKPLCREVVQAWRWGPVFHDLYHSVKKWGREPIDGYVEDYWRDGVAHMIDDGSFGAKVIDAVWRSYGKYSAARLSRITHSKDSPWSKVYAKGRRNAEIPDSLISDHYFDLLRSAVEKHTGKSF